MARRELGRRVLPARRRKQQAPSRERAKVAEWFQVLTSFLAVVIGVPALWTAVGAYQDQQEVNRSQLRVNEAQLRVAELEARRYEERYAVRVSFWTEVVGRGQPGQHVVVKVQNRSPVPVKEIHFVVSDEGVDGRPVPRLYYSLGGTAPPCSILTFRLEPTGDEAVRDPFNSFALSMRFLDSVGWWELFQSVALAPEAGAPRRLSLGELGFQPLDTGGRRYLATQVPGTRESAGDCGEGS
ncbi:hypothetical protein [Micromonospora chersina]|uniref:hypothetical protein n=1 Tax=Micromonospora chersina TaxID=47854 RepID=UPI003401A337